MKFLLILSKYSCSLLQRQKRIGIYYVKKFVRKCQYLCNKYTCVFVVFKTKCELKCQNELFFSISSKVFVLITEIFWRTFWRNKWRSVFDVVKDSSLCFKIFCFEYVTTLATVKCKCILLQLLVLSKACFTQSLTVMRILPLVFIIIVSMSNGKNLLWRDDKIFNVVRFPVCHI